MALVETESYVCVAPQNDMWDCAYRKCYPARMPLESATFKKPTEGATNRRVTMLHCVENRRWNFCVAQALSGTE